MGKISVTKNSIANFFDGWYDGNYITNKSGLEYTKIKEILSSISINPDYILDHGCGQGSWVHLLYEIFPNGDITGIDISKNGIDISKKLYPKYNFLLFDGETAPLSDNSFDLIFSYHVIDVVWDLKKSLSDISRLLRKGGHLLLIIPCGNENSFEEKITLMIDEGKENTPDGYKRYFYSYPSNLRRLKSSEIIDLLSTYDLKIVDQFFSYQFWGAIDWIGKSGRLFINELFDYRRGVNAIAKIKLYLLRVVFIAISHFVELSYANIFNTIRYSNNIIKILILPLKPIAQIFVRILNLFSIIEWRLWKKKKNGSSQYLLFEKQ